MHPLSFRKLLPAAAVLLAVALAGAPASAQQAVEADPAAQEGTEDGATAKQQFDVLPPAYDDQMMRLAEILGALHYLRELCGAKEGLLWREQMEEMIAKEQPNELRKARLIARFNRGFRSYREIYRDCTPAAAEAANRYLRQGVRLAAEIPSRYGQ